MAIEQDCAGNHVAKEINLFALFDAKRSEIFSCALCSIMRVDIL